MSAEGTPTTASGLQGGEPTIAGMQSTASVSDLLARATSRRVVHPTDGKSSSTFELVEIDGAPYFLKRLSPASDWVMRVTGDHVHRPYLVWSSGLMDRVPAGIDHAVVAMEIAGSGDDAELSMLMHDISPFLVPEGDAPVPIEQHDAFLHHLAELSATFWGWRDESGHLSTMAERIRFFDATNVARELAVAEPPGPIVAADAGWKRLAERAPALLTAAQAIHAEPSLVSDPLADTPTTFLQGDWKMGNLGSHPDGRTILLDWAYPGSGPACWDLCWYLALNAARIPETKEVAIARFQGWLEQLGIDTASWFDRQLDLCVVAMMATFGWEKALGGDDELQWWVRRVGEAVDRQGLDLPIKP